MATEIEAPVKTKSARKLTPREVLKPLEATLRVLVYTKIPGNDPARLQAESIFEALRTGASDDVEAGVKAIEVAAHRLATQPGVVAFDLAQVREWAQALRKASKPVKD